MWQTITIILFCLGIVESAEKKKMIQYANTGGKEMINDSVVDDDDVPTVDFLKRLSVKFIPPATKPPTTETPIIRNNKKLVDAWENETLENYDKDERPDEETLIQVEVSMSIIRFHSVSETQMSYGLDFYFRQVWQDPRLKFTPITFDNAMVLDLPVHTRHRVWIPDTFFPNIVSGDADDDPTTRSSLRLRYDGHMWFSKRVSIIVDCPMNLIYYPFDRQACRLKIGSYGYRAEHLEYSWSQTDTPLEFVNEKNLPEFTIVKEYIRSSFELWPSGNYSILEACFILRRNFGFALVQLIIPAALVVTSSWVALWLEEETTFNDIIAVILAIIMLSYAQSSIMPRVSYIKVMDIYLGSCTLFAFLCLAKLVILKRYRRKQEENWQKRDSFNENLHLMRNHENGGHLKNSRKCKCSPIVRCFHITTQMILPVVFIIFAVGMVWLIPRAEDFTCW